MKNLIYSTLITVLLVTGCSNQDQAEQANKVNAGAANETALEHAKKHLDPTYVCPMHPNIIRNEPGNCPICGMDLVLKEQEQEKTAAEKKLLYYRHPHNPQVTSDKPMKDEMGMDYIPVYDDGGGLSVKISPAVENNMGIRTAVAESSKLWRRVETVGYVGFDENLIAHIHLRTKGWIEKLLVKSEGERVSKGQLLFEVYAPELVNAQEEYLQALGSGSQRLIPASKDRLLALGISEQQITRLRKKRRVEQYVQVYAPQDGIINDLNVREGMFVMPSREVMSLADLSSIWILAEVFEKQADWIKEGQPADVKLSYLPGRTWEGKVEYIYPSLNPKTRTLKVRLRFDNADESLKPDMFASVTIYAGPKSNVIAIPREALIRTGTDERVILSRGEGRFQPRKVIAGIETGDWVEIVRGLDEGDVVVTSGQFLLDSEASLKASLQRMQSGSDDPTQSKLEPESSAITGSGVLHEVLADESKVNMTHEPIPALKWPGMTMDFKVRPEVKLEEFKPDDKVIFELEQGQDGYEIKSMHKHDGMGGM
ncbi:MAG: efflux RND transporter periplasmic adaptor subunit [Thioalkalispiraceae bacterium]|jgi:Cu(I)/Ag(I) efflux system membrane fusion protein